MSVKWIILVVAHLCFVRGQSPCTTPDQKPGVCKKIKTCEPLYRLMSGAGGRLVQQDSLKLLRQSQCDRTSGETKYCCPVTTTSYLTPEKKPPTPTSYLTPEKKPATPTSYLTPTKKPATPTSCLTPENKVGQCIDAGNCEHVMKVLLSGPLTPQYKEYLDRISCDGPTEYSVCCGPPPDRVVTTTLAPSLAHRHEGVPRKELPRGRAGSQAANNNNKVGCTTSAQPGGKSETNCCGVGGSSPRIYGGTATEIDQYPWLALIEYEVEKELKPMCGGALISGRYVLTAGHCVVGARNGVPKNVRLGEYDLSHPGSDCVVPDGADEDEQDCTLDPVVIPIERIIRHDEYRRPSKKHDIALIRLASVPQYSDFVQPICLPETDITLTFTNTTLYTAGWGATGMSENQSHSDIKQHVDLPFWNLEDCERAHQDINPWIQLWDRQMCAGGAKGKDTCKGDSGGPLMYYDGHRYVVIGVISFGARVCGMENVPGVYTKVFEYMPWIRKNMLP